jgi:shikimate kinase
MNYFLIGMMGSGKTTIGQLVADRLNLSYYDTDQLIEEKKGKSIARIINEEGMDYFRILEKDLLTNFPYTQSIISCGGGIILDHDNVQQMRSLGKTIYIDVGVETLIDRLRQTNQEERPLIKENLDLSIREIFKNRQNIYKQSADITIDCDGLSINEVVKQVSLYIL